MRKCLTKLTQNISNPRVIRCVSTSEAAERRSALFTLEKRRQTENVGRIEKIEVRYTGKPKETTLVMNRNLSTPYDCARHLSEWHVETSALAVINGSTVWDMHRPLTDNCTLELQNCTAAEPYQVNKAFWRTCSFMLGATASVAFKSTVPIHLHSFPGPDVRSGSFVYDIELPTLEDWRPSDVELRSLSAEFVKIGRRAGRFERLDVSEELALEMFKDNRHKSAQIPDIAAKGDGKVTLYRLEKHVDISRGPLISHVGLIGRITVAAVHKITGDTGRGGAPQLYRLQGVALPTGIIVDHFTYSIIEERARTLNSAKTPYDLFETESPMQTQQSVTA